MQTLRNSGIKEELRKKIFTADYTPEPIIEGVKIITLANHIAEDGDLSEIFRVKPNGELEQFPKFKLVQMNRIQHIAGAIKAWHLHYKQDEVWYVAPSAHLFVGLWDVRKDSKTVDITMRVVLGGSSSPLLFIPRGVAHGSANFTTTPVDLLSLVNKHFDRKNPDEMRLPWDSLGKNFWEPLKD